MSNLQISRRQKMMSRKLSTENPKILNVTIQNLVVTAFWRLGFVRP